MLIQSLGLGLDVIIGLCLFLGLCLCLGVRLGLALGLSLFLRVCLGAIEDENNKKNKYLFLV